MILQAILREHRARGKDDSLWGVARVEVVESDDGLRPGQELVAKGDLMRAAAVGELLRFEAELVVDPKWGRQLHVTRQESLGIQREQDAHRWLERLDGVGPVMARRIHDHFGGRVLEVLRGAPEGEDPLCEVEGIGPVLAQTIRESWGQIGAQGDPETLAFLDGLGLSRWEVNGVLAAARKHGESPRCFLETNPYRLIESKGFGFKRADNVATRAGVAREAPARLDAAVVFKVEEICAQDTVVPVGRLVAGVLEETGVRDRLALDAIYRVARGGGGIVLSREADVELVHPRALLEAERTIYQWATGAASEAPAGLPAGPVPDPITAVIEPPAHADLAEMADAATATNTTAPLPSVPRTETGATAPVDTSSAGPTFTGPPGPLLACSCAAGWGPADDHAPWCGVNDPSPDELRTRAERHELACEIAGIPCFVPAGGGCSGCEHNVFEFVDGSSPLGGCPNCGKSFME